ncbi:MAG TPA: MEDS domain-containing protein [Thermoanaerobaculia bacterium]|nr:MEDS domain-containing protein [Thermoanaerobaculia bacterium]
MTQSGSDSGIQAVGQVPLGTHFCQFYRTKEDLIDTLVPYFTAGLRSNELCLWVTSEPLRAAEATALMHEAMPDFEDFLSRGQIEILDFQDWYLRTGGQDGADALQGWMSWERRALDAGYEGLRLTGNTFWLEKSGWDEFMTYEEAVNQTFAKGRIIGLCTYCLDRCRAEDVLDVCRTHQFALTRRQGEWELIESSSLKIAKSELERRVMDRTSELETALRGRDEFLAMLAHELRNPLAPIRNAAQVIQLLGSTDTHLSWARDVIDRQVRQLARLVDDLLDVSRVTRGKVELHREDLELSAVIAQAVETSQPLIDSRKHSLLLSLPPEPVHLYADLTRLAQVISNLLNNAAKYMKEGGRIWLTVERHDSEVRIRIKDEGVGIPPEMLSRVFDLFTQASPSLDRSEGGLGIGLALVRSLVELHGGSVEAWSDGPERGSEFVVRLPLLGTERVAATGPREAAVPARRAAGRKVLVVDDNQDAAETLGKILEIAGHEVLVAHDGEEALAKAGRHRQEVVLLDIGLPKMDGYEVARRLRLDPGSEGLLLIAVTGYGNREDRERGKLSGFDYHLVKPIDLQQLERLLASRRRAEATH